MTNFTEWYNTKGGKSIITCIRYKKDLLTEIFNRTSFLQTNASISERVYVLVHNILNQPICPYCNNPLSYMKLNKGYHNTCQDPVCIKKHRCIVNKESSKKIDWEKSLEKQRSTMEERFGAKHNWCSGTVSREQYYDTMERIYGKRHALQNKQFINKQQITTLENNGTTDFLHCEKSRQTIINKFGIDINEVNIMSSSTVQQTYKDTCLDLYGFDNPMKNKDIFDKQQIAGFKAKYFNDLIYRGTYELDFIQTYNDKIKIENGKSLKYFYNGKKHIYHSDFFIADINLIIEIKSKYYFEKYKEQNLIKQQACIDKGFNFIFIVDKDYTEFEKLI